MTALGNGWSVMATGGHVQALPHDRKLHGKDAGKAFWRTGPVSCPRRRGLVGAASLDELTGGEGGTASRLIDILRERAQE